MAVGGRAEYKSSAALLRHSCKHAFGHLKLRRLAFLVSCKFVRHVSRHAPHLVADTARDVRGQNAIRQGVERVICGAGLGIGHVQYRGQIGTLGKDAFVSAGYTPIEAATVSGVHNPPIVLGDWLWN